MRWACGESPPGVHAGEDAEGLVADLVAVAVRAVQQVASPPLADAGDVGDLVAQAGGDQDAPCAPARSRPSRCDVEARPPARRRSGAHAVMVETVPETSCAAVPGDLGAAGGEQLGGREAVGAEEALHVGGGGVARLAGVDDGDPAAGAAEHQRGGEAGGAAADDDDVVVAPWSVGRSRAGAVAAGGCRRLVHVIQSAPL